MVSNNYVEDVDITKYQNSNKHTITFLNFFFNILLLLLKLQFWHLTYENNCLQDVRIIDKIIKRYFSSLSTNTITSEKNV